MKRYIALLPAALLLVTACSFNNPFLEDDPAQSTFTVTFESYGGSTVPSQTIATGGTVTKPEDPVKDGCVFAGWYTENTFTTLWDFTNNRITADTTLYAQWTIEFLGISANGESGVTTTTELILTFSGDPISMTEDDITVTGATLRGLAGTGTSRTLTITEVTLADGEALLVDIDYRPEEYIITPSNRTAAAKVYRLGLTMVTVPAGSFSRDGNVNNISTISKPYLMSAFETTRSQFLAIMGTDPSSTDYSSGTDDPVQRVNWYHAIAFCNKLSLKEGFLPVYNVNGITDWKNLAFASIPTTGNDDWNAVTADWSANGYRLPTEMEWMWAAIGATSDRAYTYTGEGVNYTGHHKPFAGYLNGTTSISQYAWHSGNSAGTTHPVGTTGGTPAKANELGLYDMTGNLNEWCWDWYVAMHPGGTLIDYKGKSTGTNRVYRGGAWSTNTMYCEINFRNNLVDFTTGAPNVGFRVSRQ